MLDLLHSLNPLYSLSGLAIGALVGFTGVGGGSLMTPLLVLLFGIHPATAVGTDLLYAGLTKISGSARPQFQRRSRLAHRAPPRLGQRAGGGVDPRAALAFRPGFEIGRATSSPPSSASR